MKGQSKALRMEYSWVSIQFHSVQFISTNNASLNEDTHVNSTILVEILFPWCKAFPIINKVHDEL